jgi:dTDP-4-amino-4,6-dideoxy-D-galactose acyltransferase
MTSAGRCRLLEWDSEFFGRRIGRVYDAQSDPDSARRAVAWAGENAVECLYLLVDAADTAAIRSAEDAGFRFVDIRVTLARAVEREPPAELAQVRPVRAEDLAVLREIARHSHTDSRFYADPHLPRPLCDSLYETWLVKSCDGYADAVLVAERGGRPAGYITCTAKEGTGEIGLVGVDATHRGLGIGNTLVRAALAWFADRAVSRALVVTQGRNVAAQRLYQKCGFLTDTVECWYHWWSNQ